MLSIKKLVLISIKYWWVFAISVFVCVCLAGLWYVSTPPSYSVDAALMLRQEEKNISSQGEMLKMMGGGGTKLAVDEIRVLTSRSLIEPIVDELGLTITCEKKKGLKWINMYPQRPIIVQLSEPINQIAVFKVMVKDGKYTLKGADKLIQNNGLKVELQPGLGTATYRVMLMPKLEAVAYYQKIIKVTRGNRESNILEISTQSQCPALAIDVINHILDNYNMQTATDKNILANQTDLFLSNRLDVISTELNQSETELEEYKRVHHITNLDNIAETYRQTCEQYDMELIDIDAQIRILDYTASEINQMDNQRQAFPFVDGNMPQTLVVLINEYNAHIAKLNVLLRTVDEQHPLVQQEDELIVQKRQSIQSNIEQSRQTLVLKRENIIHQKSAYQSRLEGVPEQDRVYREMKRTKTTKENQYMYLIERREENAMLMASSAIPAITIDRAQMNPKKVAPKVITTGLLAIILGLLLPWIAFFCKGFVNVLVEIKNRYIAI